MDFLSIYMLASATSTVMSRSRKNLKLSTRPPRLDGAPLDYAPENELGVVYLFSYLARRRFGLRIEKIQATFPDCIAYRGSEPIRIEFEYRSRNFAQHRHDPRGCDWIVYWIDDWPGAPSNIRVVELRKEFGLGFNVWFQPVSGEYRDVISRINYDASWSVSSQASEGDLVLFYRTSPDSFVRDLFRIAGPVEYVRAGWKPGKDWMAPIRRVCALKAPLHFHELRDHPILKHAGFVRGCMQGRYKASEYWPELYRMILARNPGLKRVLGNYGPERLG